MGPGQETPKANAALSRHSKLRGNNGASRREASKASTAKPARRKLLGVSENPEDAESETKSRAPRRTQDMASRKLPAQAWLCDADEDPRRTFPGMDAISSRRILPRISDVGPGCRRSDTSSEGSRLTQLDTKAPEPIHANECGDRSRPNRSQSITSMSKASRAMPNTDTEKSVQLAALNADNRPGCTRSSTRRVESGRQEPSHEKAKPTWADDLRDSKELRYRESGNGSTRPDRAQLKHSSSSPTQAAALDGIGKSGRVAAKADGGGLGRLRAWGNSNSPGFTQSVASNVRAVFTRPDAKNDELDLARLRKSVLEPICKKSKTGVGKAKRNMPKASERLLARDRLCRSNRLPMCKGSDASKGTSDLAVSVTAGASSDRPKLFSKGAGPGARKSGASVAMPKRTKLRTSTARPESAKSKSEGERPRRAWPQADKAELGRAKLCTAIWKSERAPPKGEEHKPKRVQLRTDIVEPRTVKSEASMKDSSLEQLKMKNAVSNLEVDRNSVSESRYAESDTAAGTPG